MKKILNILLLFTLILSSFNTIHAEDFDVDTHVSIKIPVEINDENGMVEISGDGKLPETTILKGSGEFEINYNNPQPGDIYHYIIKQVIGNDPLTIYDETEYNVSVFIDYEKDTNKIYAIAIISKDGEDTKPDECKFINEFLEEKIILPIKISQSAKKIVEGKNAPKESFTFILEAVDKNNPMPSGSKDGIKKLILQGEGIFNFGDIEFTEPGEYSYYIYEEKGNNKYFVYDSSKYTLNYSFILRDDSLVLTNTKITKNDIQISEIEFINKYEHPEEPKTPQEIITKLVQTGSGRGIFLATTSLFGALVAILKLNKKNKGVDNEK